MKTKIVIAYILLLSFSLVGFSFKNEIDNCLISFKDASHLSVSSLDRLPQSSEKVRLVKTSKGEFKVTRVDGYRVLFNNENNAPFVNLKVELSEQKSYKSDKKRLIEHLKYLNSNSSGMETKELIELNFNGYEIYGLSRNSIETGSTLGIFMMFPGDGITVYFYFNNLPPDYRHFENVEEYKELRDRFIDEYTKHLSTCR